jgi:hypothetical protein
MKKIQMSVLKPLTLAVAIVVGLSTWANAATYHQYYDSAQANTNAAEHFQNQFKNTY